jgi:hypothetical protein
LSHINGRKHLKKLVEIAAKKAMEEGGIATKSKSAKNTNSKKAGEGSGFNKSAIHSRGVKSTGGVAFREEESGAKANDSPVKILTPLGNSPLPTKEQARFMPAPKTTSPLRDHDGKSNVIPSQPKRIGAAMPSGVMAPIQKPPVGKASAIPTQQKRIGITLSPSANEFQAMLDAQIDDDDDEYEDFEPTHDRMTQSIDQFAETR